MTECYDTDIVWSSLSASDYNNILKYKELFAKKISIHSSHSYISQCDQILDLILNNFIYIEKDLEPKGHSISNINDDLIRQSKRRILSKVDFLNKKYNDKKIVIIVDSLLREMLICALNTIDIPFHSQHKKYTSRHKLLLLSHYFANCDIEDYHDLLIFNKDIDIEHLKKIYKSFNAFSFIPDLNIEISKAYKLIFKEELCSLPNESGNIINAQRYHELLIDYLSIIKVEDCSSKIRIADLSEEIVGYDLCIISSTALYQLVQNINKNHENSNQIISNKILEVLSKNRSIHAMLFNQKSSFYLLDALYDIVKVYESSIITGDSNDELNHNIILENDHIPRNMSVTGVEKLMRDPYYYYLHNIIKLRALKESEERNFGIVLHEVLSIVVHNFLDDSEAYIDYFISTAKDIMLKYSMIITSYRSLWFIKLKKIAQWFWNYEKSLLGSKLKTFTEVDCWFPMILEDDSELILNARVDRIDLMNDGKVHIIDYKSGSLPTLQDINNGLSPQIPLEALLIAKGYMHETNVDHKDDCNAEIKGTCIKILDKLGTSVSNFAVNCLYIHLTGRNDIGYIKKIDVEIDHIEKQLLVLLNKFWVRNHEFFHINQ